MVIKSKDWLAHISHQTVQIIIIVNFILKSLMLTTSSTFNINKLF